jgi:hypothetical protein
MTDLAEGPRRRSPPLTMRRIGNGRQKDGRARDKPGPAHVSVRLSLPHRRAGTREIRSDPARPCRPGARFACDGRGTPPPHRGTPFLLRPANAADRAASSSGSGPAGYPPTPPPTRLNSPDAGGPHIAASRRLARPNAPRRRGTEEIRCTILTTSRWATASWASGPTGRTSSRVPQPPDNGSSRCSNHRQNHWASGRPRRRSAGAGQPGGARGGKTPSPIEPGCGRPVPPCLARETRPRNEGGAGPRGAWEAGRRAFDTNTCK